MARFEKGNPGGPGRPPIDATVKRARTILKDCVLPALPGVVRDLLNSRNPKIVLETLRVVLPFIECPAAITVKAQTKTEVQVGYTERILMEIWAESEARKLDKTSADTLPDSGLSAGIPPIDLGR